MSRNDKIEGLIEDLSPIEGRFKVIKEAVKDIGRRVDVLESVPSAPMEFDSIRAEMAEAGKNLVRSEEYSKNSIANLHDRIDEVSLDVNISERKSSYQVLKHREEVGELIEAITHNAKKTRREIEELISEISKSSAKDAELLTQSLESLKEELVQDIFLLKNRPYGNGNMNRQEWVNGVDVLTRYTDINWKAGSNVTITAVNNNTTHHTDITISSTGGSGGSGYQAPLTGGLTGTNTWTNAPNVIVVDGVPKQQTQTDGTINWTGTTTTVLTVNPTFDVFASA